MTSVGAPDMDSRTGVAGVPVRTEAPDSAAQSHSASSSTSQMDLPLCTSSWHVGKAPRRCRRLRLSSGVPPERIHFGAHRLGIRSIALGTSTPRTWRAARREGGYHTHAQPPVRDLHPWKLGHWRRPRNVGRREPHEASRTTLLKELLGASSSQVCGTAVHDRVTRPGR